VSLPPGWIAQQDPATGGTFYVNTNVNPPVTQWNPPAAFAPPPQGYAAAQGAPQGYPGQPGAPQGYPGQPQGYPAQPGTSPAIPLLQQALNSLNQSAGLLRGAAATEAVEMGMGMGRGPRHHGPQGLVGLAVDAGQKNKADQGCRLAQQAVGLLQQARQLDPSIPMIQPPDVQSIGGIISQGLFDNPAMDAIRVSKLKHSEADVVRCASSVQQVLAQMTGQPMGGGYGQPGAAPVQQVNTGHSGPGVGGAIVAGALLGNALHRPARRF